jgi:hypothetical protein
LGAFTGCWAGSTLICARGSVGGPTTSRATNIEHTSQKPQAKYFQLLPAPGAIPGSISTHCAAHSTVFRLARTLCVHWGPDRKRVLCRCTTADTVIPGKRPSRAARKLCSFWDISLSSLVSWARLREFGTLFLQIAGIELILVFTLILLSSHFRNFCHFGPDAWSRASHQGPNRSSRHPQSFPAHYVLLDIYSERTPYLFNSSPHHDSNRGTENSALHLE